MLAIGLEFIGISQLPNGVSFGNVRKRKCYRPRNREINIYIILFSFVIALSIAENCHSLLCYRPSSKVKPGRKKNWSTSPLKDTTAGTNLGSLEVQPKKGLLY